MSQRSLCAAQPSGEVLLGTHIREYLGETGHFLLVSCTPEGVERLADVFGVQVGRLKFSLREVVWRGGIVQTWVPIHPALSISVMLNRLFHLLKPQFSHLQNEIALPPT